MTITNGLDANHLQSIVERIEHVERKIADEQEVRREIYAEAKSVGFDPRMIRKAVAMRKQDRAKREEEQAILELYLNALGMD